MFSWLRFLVKRTAWILSKFKLAGHLNKLVQHGNSAQEHTVTIRYGPTEISRKVEIFPDAGFIINLTSWKLHNWKVEMIHSQSLQEQKQYAGKLSWGMG